MIEYRKFDEDDLDEVISLLQEENWPSYIENPNNTCRAFTAPEVITLVAVDDNKVVGFVQLLTDNHIQAFIPAIIVAKSHRNKGIGRELIEKAFKMSGAKRIDLLTDEDSDEFYKGFTHKRMLGYRIHPKK